MTIGEAGNGITLAFTVTLARTAASDFAVNWVLFRWTTTAISSSPLPLGTA
jgi:hypothetical protein